MQKRRLWGENQTKNGPYEPKSPIIGQRSDKSDQVTYAGAAEEDAAARRAAEEEIAAKRAAEEEAAVKRAAK